MEYGGFNLKLHSDTTMYSIHTIGKGPLPKVLQGLFTTNKEAMKHIDLYNASKGVTKE